MDTVLKELYHGKNYHTNRIFAQSQERTDFRQLLDSKAQMVQQLEEVLDETALMQFHTYYNMNEKCASIEREELFTYAFRLGARMMAEILSPCEAVSNKESK